jgi:hypothetical protein
MNVPRIKRIEIKVKMPGTGPGVWSPLMVDARVMSKGLFALHHPIYVKPGEHTPTQEAKDWTLTHVPTGHRLMRGITTIKQGMSIAKELARAGSAECRIDWNFTDVLTLNPEMRKRAKDLTDRLKEVYGLPAM